MNVVRIQVVLKQIVLKAIISVMVNVLIQIMILHAVPVKMISLVNVIWVRIVQKIINNVYLVIVKTL